jgi:regulator of protease activity HflC (stomatin/prohibitin superfamily)
MIDKVRELLREYRKYLLMIGLPLLFATLTTLLVLPAVAAKKAALPPIAFWPIIIAILVVTIAQIVCAYYADTDAGILAVSTVGGFFLYLLIAAFSLFGLLAGVALLLLLLVIFIVLWRSYVKIVPETYVDIVYTFGKYSHTLESGFNVVLPWEKVAQRLYVGEMQWVCPEQRIQMPQQDDQDVVARAIVSYQLMPQDAYLAATQVKNWEQSLQELFISQLHTVLKSFIPADFIPWSGSMGSHATSETHGSEDAIMPWEYKNDELFQPFSDHVALWGVQVYTVRLRDVRMVPHGTPLPSMEQEVSTPSSGMAAAFDNDATTESSAITQQSASTETTKNSQSPQAPSQTPEADADKAASKEEKALAQLYAQVQNGKITNPATIRSYAAKFDAAAKDATLNQTISFDVERAARNLYAEAEKAEAEKAEAEKHAAQQSIQ